MEQLVFILVVALIGIVKWLMEKSAEQRAKRETQERLDRVGRGETEPPPVPTRRPAIPPIDSFPKPDVAARRLREALGLPPGDGLPPAPKAPLPAPAEYAPRPVLTKTVFKTVPAADLEQRMIAPPPVPARKLAPKRVQPEAAAPPRSVLEGLLGSREGLRKAILAREILGTPKGLVF